EAIEDAFLVEDVKTRALLLVKRAASPEITGGRTRFALIPGEASPGIIGNRNSIAHLSEEGVGKTHQNLSGKCCAYYTPIRRAIRAALILFGFFGRRVIGRRIAGREALVGGFVHIVPVLRRIRHGVGTGVADFGRGLGVLGHAWKMGFKAGGG